MPTEILSFSFTPVVDTAIYAANELLFDTTEVTTKLKTFARSGKIVGVEVNDKDGGEQAAFDIVFLKENRDAGTINNAPTITDAHSDDTIGMVRIGATDYRDVGSNSQVSISNLNIPFDVSGAGIYAYGVNGSGTPTYTAATDLVIRVWVEVYC